MQRVVEALAEETFDVLILGGGITGAGVALDAALRGWRVALLDKGDFASGTSSVSSKLVHGGLRYLEQGDLPLVYEALQERGRLLHNAPHLVRPLRFLLPFVRGSRMPAWKWRLGLTLYDLLAGKSNIRRSRPVTSSILVRQCPGLRDMDLQGGAEFHDAQMDDARLCLDVLQTAVKHGAVLANYVEAVAFEKQGAAVTGVHVIDHVGDQEMVLRGRRILNATGPWVDRVCALAGETDAPNLQPTKGVHIVLPCRDLPAGFLLLHPADGRVFFVLPWMGKTLVGTTDTFTPAGPDNLAIEPGETAYLLEGFNRYFQPEATSEDVLGAFAGLRPLLRARAEEPSSRSREYRLWQGTSGMFSVAGGKYTTYRLMAEIITDRLGASLGKKQRCRTRDFPLDGAPTEAWSIAYPRLVTALGQAGLGSVAANHLVHRYGRRAIDVIPYLAATPGYLLPGEPDLRGELAYQRDHEMAVFPEDHWLRRTRLGLFKKVSTWDLP